MKIELNNPLKPNMTLLEGYLKQINNSGWYTNFGPLHKLLTERLEAYLGVKNLLLVSNGTLAIQVACRALNITSAVTTPFSFVATSSSLLWQNIKIAFSDIDPKTFNLCPIELEKSFSKDPDYDGIVATHVYGNPCNVNKIDEVAKKFRKKVVYDASHAFGINLGNQSLLGFADASTLSFHATKVFHTVEGGAIIFKNKADYDKARMLINFGIAADGSLGEPGINAKLNEYQCAVGLTLLDDIEEVLNKRAALYNLYKMHLSGIVDLPKWHPEANVNGAYFAIYIDDKSTQEALISSLESNNIQSRRYFTPSLDIAYKHVKSFGCPQSQKIAEGVICLPLHFYLSEKDVMKVIETVKNVLIN